MWSIFFSPSHPPSPSKQKRKGKEEGSETWKIFEGSTVGSHTIVFGCRLSSSVRGRRGGSLECGDGGRSAAEWRGAFYRLTQKGCEFAQIKYTEVGSLRRLQGSTLYSRNREVRENQAGILQYRKNRAVVQRIHIYALGKNSIWVPTPQQAISDHRSSLENQHKVRTWVPANSVKGMLEWFCPCSLPQHSGGAGLWNNIRRNDSYTPCCWSWLWKGEEIWIQFESKCRNCVKLFKKSEMKDMNHTTIRCFFFFFLITLCSTGGTCMWQIGKRYFGMGEAIL